MVRDEKALTGVVEQEFLRRRSKALGNHFMEFVLERGLDMDSGSWSPVDRAEFDRQSRALIGEWKRKGRALPGARDDLSGPSAMV